MQPQEKWPQNIVKSEAKTRAERKGFGDRREDNGATDDESKAQ